MNERTIEFVTKGEYFINHYLVSNNGLNMGWRELFRWAADSHHIHTVPKGAIIYAHIREEGGYRILWVAEADRKFLSPEYLNSFKDLGYTINKALL